MGKKNKGPNTKVVAAQEKKAESKRKKEGEALRKNKEEEAKEWAKGSNLRGAARSEAEANKADEAARRRQEKKSLLEQEEATLATAPKPKKPNNKSKKKKNKDEFALLEESLVNDATKKTKAKKAARLKQEEQRRKQSTEKEEEKIDPLMKNTLDIIGDEEIGRAANIASLDDANGISGINNALASLNTKDAVDQHPEKRKKAMHKAFEERMMPKMKEKYPGLRMNQYKDKIFQLWKKSPENPMNQNL